MAREPEPTASWIDAFAPEMGEVGIAGILTSLSAESTFLESALEAFTSDSRGARRSSGRIIWTLLADPCQPELVPNPGLYQAFARPGAWSPAQCQHSKIALLLYGRSTHGSATSVRLLVSTGNWTNQTSDGSIDLLWRCDLTPKIRGTEALAAEAADILAALDFVTHLRRRYLVPAAIENALDHVTLATRNLADPHRRGPRIAPRFIATLGAQAEAATAPAGRWQRGSLGAQVMGRFRDGAARRNLLVCGSGFFEKAADAATEPRVLTEIVASLRAQGSLATVPDGGGKFLVANPGTAGAVGPWVCSGTADDDDWFVASPRHPLTDAVEPFHAKYILLANSRARVTGAQLYLGSGNLSIQGFLKGCLGQDPQAHGNVEAGVVIEVENTDLVSLFGMLGIDAEEAVDPSQFTAGATDDREDIAGPVPRTVPPVIAAVWQAAERSLLLVRAPADERPCTITCGTTPFAVTATTAALTLNADLVPPTRLEVALTDVDPTTWTVPVFLVEGGFCRGAPERYDLDEALDRLLDFPGGDDTDADDVDDDDEGAGGSLPPGADALGAAPTRSYPIHRAMQLVETLAERNQTIAPDQFPDWRAHLRRVLIDDIDPSAIAAVRSLGINVLEPLLAEPGFAPPIADAQYVTLVRDVLAHWGLDALPGFAAPALPQGVP